MIQAVKMRGLSPQPGFHSVRIAENGVQVYPRMIKPVEEAQAKLPFQIISTGVKGLDEMPGGGTLTDNAMLVAGPAGSGKTTLVVPFVNEGVKEEEPGVTAIFEETTPKHLDQVKQFGFYLEEMQGRGLLRWSTSA